LERERELLMANAAEGMGGLQLNNGAQQEQERQASPVRQVMPPIGLRGGDEDSDEDAESSAMAGRRRSSASAARAAAAQTNGGSLAGKASGKRAAMMNIREREKGYAPNGLIL
jgi:hypothetical protein